MSAAGMIGALARSCHPAPTLAVTCFATVLGAAAGNDAATCVLLAVAVFAGQLSIGWSNDRIDAGRDRLAARVDKPVAVGEIAVATIDQAIGTALLVTVGFSLSLGWRAGLTHLAAVGCGWLYNAWLKGTWLSFVPYALAFGALPAVATLALPAHPAPAAWVVGAGALLGISANLTNALPDLVEDREAGVLGLPHRIGARPSLALAVLALVAATACLALGPPGAAGTAGWTVLAISVALGAGGAAALWRKPDGKAPFYGIVAVVALDLLLVVLARQHLH